MVGVKIFFLSLILLGISLSTILINSSAAENGETTTTTATLIARRGSTVVFEQSDVPLKRFDFEIKTTPWYLFAS